MRVALVLGSGGARGYAHIPVINELVARGHDIVAVGGCSMGALIGGYYAAGKLDDFTEMALGLSQADLIRLADPALTEPGFLGLKRVSHMLAEILGPTLIEELPMPYTAVATDLLNRREVWFTEGSLYAAIRASISIPVAFTPVRIAGRVLVDGGILNPLPLETVTWTNADVTVAVSLLERELTALHASSTEEPAKQIESRQLEPRPIEPKHGALDRWEGSWLGALVRRMAPQRPEVAPGVPLDDAFEPLPKGLTSVDVMMKALDAMQSVISTARTGVHPPDVLVKVPAERFDVSDFHRCRAIMDLGLELAVEEFDRMGL